MKKALKFFALSLVFCASVALLSGVFSDLLKGIDIPGTITEATTNVESDSDVDSDEEEATTPGADSTDTTKTTTVMLYAGDRLIRTETSTIESPTIGVEKSGSSAIQVNFCSSAIYSNSLTFLGLSIANDGDVVSSEGDIIIGTGMNLTAGETYIFYLIFEEEAAVTCSRYDCSNYSSSASGYCSTNCENLSNNGACTYCGYGLNFNGVCVNGSCSSNNSSSGTTTCSHSSGYTYSYNSSDGGFHYYYCKSCSTQIGMTACNGNPCSLCGGSW